MIETFFTALALAMLVIYLFGLIGSWVMKKKARNAIDYLIATAPLQPWVHIGGWIAIIWLVVFWILYCH